MGDCILPKGSSRYIYIKGLDMPKKVTKKKVTKKKVRSPAQKKGDVIWDALSALYFNPVIKQDQARMGKLCKGFREHKATPDEIARRRALLIDEWGSKTDTPESLLKHWGRYAPEKVVGTHIIHEHPIYTMVGRDNPPLLRDWIYVNDLIKRYESGETSMANVRLAIRKWRKN